MGVRRYVIYRNGYWAKGEERLVRLIRITEEHAMSDVTMWEVEDLLTGQVAEVPDYNLYMSKIYNDMEALAWAASRSQ